MRPNFYKILDDCVESGVELGYRRAHKYYDVPPESAVKEFIHNAVMDQINELFIFEEVFK
jgi:hypothetical protein